MTHPAPLGIDEEFRELRAEIEALRQELKDEREQRKLYHNALRSRVDAIENGQRSAYSQSSRGPWRLRDRWVS